ncbi:hypothetical protein LPB86_12165 [Pedobacter sp. MC2016-14]|uniref:hypothetical protein n=1 Tax=Pedobacter sp. MC2016-14 TaxID=2897327 RepID=UPI001E4AA236|nr:hypothetical protein [Pedobacter sp. MC2016-14]MCD0488986.1 hypothetical protein [Pedobacter sp. MC2016-14]
MDSKEPKKDTQTPVNEGYDINNPQNTTKPSYNSGSAHREAGALPGVENLNQNKLSEVDNPGEKLDNSGIKTPINDESLTGSEPKTDLGNGQRKEDEGEKEKIIRT